MHYSDYYSQHTITMKSSLIRELVASTKNIPGLISFAGGFPSPQTFPKQALSELYHEIVNTEGNDILQYGSSEGDPILVDELLQWDGYPNLTRQNILITSGATNGIYYFGKTFLNEGDIVICEIPTFLGTIVSLDALGANVVGIPIDEEGIDINVLKNYLNSNKHLQNKIKFIYTIPDFQNPSGVTMTLKRRKELIELATEYRLPILEDNPYNRLRYMGQTVPTIYRIAHDEYKNDWLVTEVASFSKILGPGMRLAYVKGNHDIINQMCIWQQKATISPDGINQRVAARFIQKGLMNPHIDSICKFYKPYLDRMLDALEREMPKFITWTKPEGGIFLWLWLPDDFDGDKVFEDAKDYKVSFIPGSHFYPELQKKVNCMRLNFSYPTLEQIDEGIKRLGQLLRSYRT